MFDMKYSKWEQDRLKSIREKVLGNLKRNVNFRTVTLQQIEFRHYDNLSDTFHLTLAKTTKSKHKIMKQAREKKCISRKKSEPNYLKWCAVYSALLEETWLELKKELHLTSCVKLLLMKWIVVWFLNELLEF